MENVNVLVEELMLEIESNVDDSVLGQTYALCSM